ncbi:KAP family P-loop NTPase fold protein [Acinetobacter shaoyimingii]|uniref:P-loop ATPase n=1 Tax=Acinetobacter shaoyimingii TaxID=2715164 RepID=A0A6G8RXB2_9GAMM|nr:P-loop NTPase fold protein [Acinetobacter shaoyimingii]QIO06582.1 P-loop ATPase [Acinetobacter shaoyimingii]
MDNNQLNWHKDDFENIKTTWEGDLWDRRRLGEQLTQYVDRLQCGAVLALDARWGEGKTWFVRHWAKHLSDTDHNVIYLDAFANDYLEDPFLVISSEITSCLSKGCDVDQCHINTFKQKAAAAYHALLPSLPKVLLTLGLNLISGGVLGTVAQEIHKVGEKAIESAIDEISDKIKESIEEKIETHEADKNTLFAFKQELAKLAEQLDKPLVFIIDELDRCRPDFAIRLIERIKHFFDIKNIVFVLVMNKPQLLQSVKSFYGYDSEMNGDYLEKFVDFTIHLKTDSEGYDYEAIIKSQLFRIGELSSLDDRNELLYWTLGLQLDKQLNSRELIKKLNQYALLRTENKNKNLVLLSVIMGVEPYANYYIYISSVVKKLVNYLCKNKMELLRRHNLRIYHDKTIDDIRDAEWYRIILESDLNIESIFINIILNAYDSFHGDENMEYQLNTVLKEVSIYNLNHPNDFINDWKAYILRGI